MFRSPILSSVKVGDAQDNLPLTAQKSVEAAATG